MADLPGVAIVATAASLRTLVPCLKRCGFPVRGVWGASAKEAEALASEHDVAFSSNRVDELLLLKEVDLVFVDLPPHSLHPVVLKVLGIGKDMVCGGTAGLGRGQLAELGEAAQYYPTLLSVPATPLRFLPAVARMKELVAEGYCGKVQAVEVVIRSSLLTGEAYDWRCDHQMGGGALNVHGSQALDVLQYVTGCSVERVQALLRVCTTQTASISGIRHITADDFASLHLSLRNGLSATLTVNCLAECEYSHEMVVSGSQGRLLLHDANLFGRQRGAAQDEVLVEDSSSSAASLGVGEDASAGSVVALPHLRGLARFCATLSHAFADTEQRQSLSRKPLPGAATFKEAERISRVLEAARSSDETKSWTIVEY